MNAGDLSIKSGDTSTSVPTSVSPAAGQYLTVDEMPYSTLDTFRNRIERLCRSRKRHFWQRWDWTGFFTTVSVLCFGGAVGGAIGAIPFWATEPSHRAKIEYMVVLVVVIVLAIGSLFGRIGRTSAEAESVEAIYHDFSGMVDGYKESIEHAEEIQKLKMETEHATALAAIGKEDG
jgi:hypothetical protein